MTVVVKTADRSLPDGCRFAVFETLDDAVRQVVHDAAREGRPPASTFHEGGRVEVEEEGRLVVKVEAGDAISVPSMTQAIKDERARLEKGQDAFVPAELLARLTRAQIEALRAELG